MTIIELQIFMILNHMKLIYFSYFQESFLWFKIESCCAKFTEKVIPSYCKIANKGTRTKYKKVQQLCQHVAVMGYVQSEYHKITNIKCVYMNIACVTNQVNKYSIIDHATSMPIVYIASRL